MAEKNPNRLPEKVSALNVRKEKGYLYYIDKDGDVARVPAKWNEDPEFLEKNSLTETEFFDDPSNLMPLEEEFEEPVNVPEPTEEHHEPIPVTEPDVPAHFMDKLIFYYDKAVIETAGDNALSQAHLKVYPKKAVLIDTLEEEHFIHNATIASFSASILFETLKAQGTNIIFNEIDGTMQTSIIPRFEGDGLNLFWEIKPGDQNEIKAIAENIKSKIFIGEQKDTTKINLDDNKSEKPKKKVNIIDSNNEKINYMIEHLRRDF